MKKILTLFTLLCMSLWTIPITTYAEENAVANCIGIVEVEEEANENANSETVAVATATAKLHQKGEIDADANGDGKINLDDAFVVLQYYSKNASGANLEYNSKYDVYPDGQIDLQDAFLILQIVAQKATEGEKETTTTTEATTTEATTTTVEAVTTTESTTATTDVEATTSTRSTTNVVTNVDNSTTFKSGDVARFDGISWNLRSSPDLSNDENIIVQLKTGDKFLVIQPMSGNWLKISFRGAILWCCVTDATAFTKVDESVVTVTKETTATTTTTTTAKATTTATTTTTTTVTTTTTTTSATTTTTTTTTKVTTEPVKTAFSPGDTVKLNGGPWNLRDVHVGNVLDTLYSGETFTIVSYMYDNVYEIYVHGGIFSINMTEPDCFRVESSLKRENEIGPQNPVKKGEFIKFVNTSWYIALDDGTTDFLVNGEILFITNIEGETVFLTRNDGSSGSIILTSAGYGNFRMMS